MAALGGQPIQHRKGARQHRRHGQGELLPRHALAFAHFKVTLPVVNLAPMQADQSMGVIVLGDLPDLRTTDHHAQFFFQLAAQGLLHGLAGFELATRKLPIARIGLALGAGTQKQRAIRSDEDTDRHFRVWAISHGHAPQSHVRTDRPPGHCESRAPRPRPGLPDVPPHVLPPTPRKNSATGPRWSGIHPARTGRS